MDVNSSYNFNTLAPSILQGSYQGMTLLATVNFDIAATKINVIVQQRKIYPELPSGTPDDPKQYMYYIFRDMNGKEVVLADAWIDTNSIVKVTSIAVTVVVTQCTTADATLIQNQLNLLGYKGRFTMTTKNT
jgi:hypothetical protein